MLKEKGSIRIDNVVVRGSAERNSHVGNALLATLDLYEHADRCFIDGNDHIFVRELFAILFVAKPHVETELTEDTQEHLAVADDGFEFLRTFIVDG